MKKEEKEMRKGENRREIKDKEQKGEREMNRKGRKKK